ncbi:Methyltransferase small domain-containing protein [Variovorax sp. YR634]|uniref:methyltransferase n=1 Tax=Variovorax sp. YR634 TaxID=1884385 RepID=UPI00089B1AF2|nr:methyltransferase [Variovorax sp. YR634]SDX15726.1 Methyltransferase small domain-containing protein [Variovorax sp. YR634]
MKIDENVMAVLSVAQVLGNDVVLTGQLDRKLYEKTNKVLEAAGGKWNRKAKAHVFDTDAATRIDQMLLSGEVDVPKDEFNFFPTPPAVVKKLIALAGICPGMTVLEPSAGTGAIAWPCAAAGAKVDCYEIQQGNAFTLAMSAPHELGRTSVADFLGVDPEPIYDRVVMNPPFLKQSDIKHVTHALKFLKPGGLLVAVMSAGVVFRNDARTAEFRALVDTRGGHIEALPENSFKESGTGVNTVVAVIPEAS